ncbi:keratin, type I cytoskeletal 13-like [Lepisosteus oculatus]|uniref:keratin, type I cytoskeletal 13-like n=1 Tax=Lepisosteus oculatus TaxID=7918 RepID=UPI00371A7D9C
MSTFSARSSLFSTGGATSPLLLSGGGGSSLSSSRMGGRGVHVSSASVRTLSSSLGGLSLGDSGGNAALSHNDKATMQNLNDRLASYLEKVRSLEAANGELELKIKEKLESNTAVSHDFSAYYAAIKDLNDQIHEARLAHFKTVLDIDNTKLAEEDFRMKFENETSMRMVVEADITGLRRMLDEMTLARADLDLQIEGLKEELVFLKKNHEEEMVSVRAELGGQVNVEVDVPAGMDLARAMADIREQYEALTAKNQRELEAWYQGQVATVQQEVTEQNESLQISQGEVKQLKSTLQSLQIERQSSQSMKEALEASLAETQARCSAQLASLQAVVSSLEAQLAHLRSDIEEDGEQYRRLLDIKTRLELEIEKYRHLLDGGESSKSEVTTTATVVTVMKESEVSEPAK